LGEGGGEVGYAGGHEELVAGEMGSETAEVFDCVGRRDAFWETDFFPGLTAGRCPHILALIRFSYDKISISKRIASSGDVVLLPPGRATSPACVRNCIDLVVNATCKSPFRSPHSKINTEALFFHGAAKLLTTPKSAPGTRAWNAGTYSRGALYVRNR
jgi:hypothetical protein